MKRKITTKELKEIELDLVKYFHNLCEQNGLHYYMIGGTLLGAVRHEGFIPWDDDIDVEMPRDDYERLIDIFDSVNKRNDVDLVCLERNAEFYVPYAKLINTKTYLREEVDKGIDIGVFIDIFPIDNLSDSYEESKKIFRRVEILRNILTIKNLVNNNERSIIKRLIIGIGKVLFSPLSRKSIVSAIISKSKQYNNPLSKYVGVVTSGMYGAEKEVFPREWFQKSEMLSFEDTNLYASNGYKEILCQFYGDYMKLPPVEKRVTHHGFEAWVEE